MCPTWNFKYTIVVASGDVRGMLIITVHPDQNASLFTAVPKLTIGSIGILLRAEMWSFFPGQKSASVLVKEEIKTNVQRLQNKAQTLSH